MTEEDLVRIIKNSKMEVMQSVRKMFTEDQGIKYDSQIPEDQEEILTRIFNTEITIDSIL